MKRPLLPRTRFSACRCLDSWRYCRRGRDGDGHDPALVLLRDFDTWRLGKDAPQRKYTTARNEARETQEGARNDAGQGVSFSHPTRSVTVAPGAAARPEADAAPAFADRAEEAETLLREVVACHGGSFPAQYAVKPLASGGGGPLRAGLRSRTSALWSGAAQRSSDC